MIGLESRLSRLNLISYKESNFVRCTFRNGLPQKLSTVSPSNRPWIWIQEHQKQCQSKS